MMYKIYLFIIALASFLLSSAGQSFPEPIELWYGNQQVFGNMGNSHPWINLIGQVQDYQNLHVLSYSFDSRRAPLNTGPTAFRLAEPGEFNIEIDRSSLQPGEHELTIFAGFKDGTEYKKNVQFIMKNEPSPLPLEVFWPEVECIQDVAHVVDGKWAITPDGLRTMSIGYDRAVALGDLLWTDYQMETEFIIHHISDEASTFMWPSMHVALHVAFRWQGHIDWNDVYPRRGWSAFGALFSYGYRPERGEEKTIWFVNQLKGGSVKANHPTQLETSVPYMMKARVYSRPGLTSMYEMKLWKKEDPEPEMWDIQAEGLPGELINGSILLVAHHADISFKRVRVEKVNPD